MSRLISRTSITLGFFLVFSVGVATGQVRNSAYNPSGKQIPIAIPSGFNSKVRIDQGLASRLEFETRSAFLRSLMPLEDYLTHIAMARDARLSGDAISPAEALGAWENYRTQIQSIVPAMHRLQQPAAVNSAAEIAWARYAILRADLRIAQMTKNDGDAAGIREYLQDASTQLLSQRQSDYKLGLANLSDVAYATDRFLAANDYSISDRATLRDYQRSLQESWNSAGAEIGRSDKLIETKLSQDLVGLQFALQGGKVDTIKSQLAAVNQVSHQHFAQSLSYYKNGTAPLHQLTRSITLRQRLNRLGEEAPELDNVRSKELFQDDWSQLKLVASTRADRSGRISADLLAIDLLGQSIDVSK